MDFYLSRPRREFIGEAAPGCCGRAAEVIEGDMNRLIDQLEAYAQKQAGKPQPASRRWCPTRTRPRG